MIQRHSGFEYVKKHSLFLNNAIDNNSILLRAEIIKDNSVVLMTVWASEVKFQDFLKSFSDLSKIPLSLKKENLSLSEEKLFGNKDTIRQFFQGYSDCPYVIHYAHMDFRSTLATSS